MEAVTKVKPLEVKVFELVIGGGGGEKRGRRADSAGSTMCHPVLESLGEEHNIAIHFALSRTEH